ncbi:MAG: BlaI/MecI/CopY family transcriptional regulator [Terriglobales bacterium]
MAWSGVMPLPPRKRKPAGAPLPSGGELDILAVLWRLKAATVRQVHEALAKVRGYTTTLKQMQIMADKGLIVRSERFGVHVYAAAVPRKQMQKRVAGDLLTRVFGGSTGSLVLGALEARRASDEELAEIRKMIDTYRNQKRP